MSNTRMKYDRRALSLTKQATPVMYLVHRLWFGGSDVRSWTTAVASVCERSDVWMDGNEGVWDGVGEHTHEAPLSQQAEHLLVLLPGQQERWFVLHWGSFATRRRRRMHGHGMGQRWDTRRGNG